jgi:hypothetical protein
VANASMPQVSTHVRYLRLICGMLISGGCAILLSPLALREVLLAWRRHHAMATSTCLAGFSDPLTGNCADLTMRCDSPAPRSMPYSLFTLKENESLPIGLPSGVTPAMLSFAADAGLEVETPQIVIAAFLGGANHTHRAGSFRDVASHLGRARGQSSARAFIAKQLLEQHVGRFLARSPGLCGAPLTKLHIVHDLNLGAQSALLDTHAGQVVFHEFSENPQVLGNDWRFQHYDHILQRSQAWGCAWAVDLTDVGVIKMPPCSLLPERSLVAAADGQTKEWLRAVGRSTRLNLTWSLNFGNFLRKNQGLRPFSCSIVGGRRSAFLPALREVVKRLAQHRAFLAAIGQPNFSIRTDVDAATVPARVMLH